MDYQLQNMDYQLQNVDYLPIISSACGCLNCMLRYMIHRLGTQEQEVNIEAANMAESQGPTPWRARVRKKFQKMLCKMANFIRFIGRCFTFIYSIMKIVDCVTTCLA